MLRCEAGVSGNGHNGAHRGEIVEAAVVRYGPDRPHHKTGIMEVDEHGESLAGVAGGRRGGQEVEAREEMRGHGHFPGYNACGGVATRWMSGSPHCQCHLQHERSWHSTSCYPTVDCVSASATTLTLAVREGAHRQTSTASSARSTVT